MDDCLKCQTSTATPAEPGDLLWRLGRAHKRAVMPLLTPVTAIRHFRDCPGHERQGMASVQKPPCAMQDDCGSHALPLRR
jgi:hypothetical protein